MRRIESSGETPAAERRRFRRMLVLAALLAIAAGAVNATGFFGFGTLVTNVTGHFAAAAHDVVDNEMILALEEALWIFSFAFGAFSTTALMLSARRTGATFAYAKPILVEVSVLVLCAIFGGHALAVGGTPAAYLTAALLFAMGLQNATITVISNAVVRTTHLTGTLTDIGISASRYVFDATPAERVELGRKLRLHLTLVGAFCLGAFGGGTLFQSVGFRALLLPIVLLLVSLGYDLYQYRNEARIRSEARAAA